MDAVEILSYRDKIYGYLVADNRFDVDHAGRYVNFTFKGRFLKTSLYPALHVYFSSKVEEAHQAIGYSPWVTLIYIVESRILVPLPDGQTTPTQLLTDTGIADEGKGIDDLDEAEAASLKILEAMEDVLRFDATDAGMQKRRLETDNVNWALPRGATTRIEEFQNGWVYRVGLNIEVFVRVVS